MKPTLPALLVFTLISCQSQKPAASLNETITINLHENVPTQGPAEEWIDELQFIALETTPECYLASRVWYNLDKENIVVASDETIHLFSRNGKHLKSFKKQGKGPGEYGQIYAIDLVSDRKEIMVSNPNQRKILCYDFSGNLTAEIQTPFMTPKVVPVSGGFFACFYGRLRRWGVENPELYQMGILNREGKTISKYMPFKYTMTSTTSADFTRSGEEGVYFINPSYSYDICQAGPGDTFQIKYRFSYADYNIDTSLLENERLMNSKNPHETFVEKFVDLDHMAITTNTISFWGPVMLPKLRLGTRQINRTSGNVRFMELDSLFTFGKYAGIPIDFEAKSSGDYFIFKKDAVDLLEILKKLTPEQKKILSKCKGFDRLATLKEDDNPVLVLYKVASF